MCPPPKVSVLMPLYKTNENYLKEAIESVLNQTFGDFEFLILDDCPEDSREEIVKTYGDSRIRYFKNEKNLGITPSRNKLIDLAHGKYLAVFDHDDLCLPTRLEEQVAYLDAHPKCGVVGSWMNDFLQKKVYQFPANDFEIKKLLMGVCAIVHSGAMIRKSVLIEHHLRYEEAYTPSEDYCLWLRLIEFTEFHNIQKPLIGYRMHMDNTTCRQRKKMNLVTHELKAYAHMKYPHLFAAYINDCCLIVKIKLFGFFPILRIVKQGNKSKIYLFNKILLFSYRKKFFAEICNKGSV